MLDKRQTRTWAEIDLSALASNVRISRSAAPCGDRIFAIVKANAYGHGAVSVSKMLESEGLADGLAVATPDEALEIREHNIKLPVLILGYSHPMRLKELIAEGGIYPTVFSLRSAEELSAAAGETPAECFLALDSGMGRIGLPTENGLDEAKKIFSLPGIKIVGVFSHFACADMDDNSDAREQEKRFDGFCRKMTEAGLDIRVMSLYNSAAAVLPEFSESHGITRLGISMYGLHPSEFVKMPGLVPVMSLKSRIAQVRYVEAGKGISYGHTFISDRRMKVATVSAGYSDGYPRILSGRANVLVRGTECPILGRICMDMMMIDVSAVEDADVGDEVTLFGKDAVLTADVLAEKAGTIGYELISGISPRVPRVYIRNGIITD